MNWSYEISALVAPEELAAKYYRSVGQRSSLSVYRLGALLTIFEFIELET